MLQAFEGIMSVLHVRHCKETMTADVAANRNLASNVLHVRHDSLPMTSNIFCIFVTTFFVETCLVARLLTISTASLQAFGAYPISSDALTSNPTKNLFLNWSRVMGRESVKRCGLFLNFLIRRVTIFTIFIIEEMKFLKSCMSSAWTKDTLT